MAHNKAATILACLLLGLPLLACGDDDPGQNNHNGNLNNSNDNTNGGPVCGDGVQEGDEVCDGSDLGGVSCEDRGFSGGTLACAGHCQAFDTGECILCEDDADEPDDDAAHARLVDLAAGPSLWSDSVICAGDDDWLEVELYAGETLYATLTFQQADSGEDLDLLLFQGAVNLTGCDEIHPASCDAANGQSRTSDESLSWPIVETGTYHLVVHGWQGAENTYDLCVSLDANDCP